MTSIKVGIIEVKDLKVVKIFTPLFFVIVHFVALVAEFRKDDLINQSKILSNYIYKLDNTLESFSKNKFNDFNISLLPFYIVSEILVTVKEGCLDSIVFLLYSLLTLSFSLGLYCFQFYVLIELFGLWGEDLFAKLIFIFTCMLIILSIYYSIKITTSKRKLNFE